MLLAFISLQTLKIKQTLQVDVDLSKALLCNTVMRNLDELSKGGLMKVELDVDWRDGGSQV